MSKVIHLSDEAHQIAKEHCQKLGLRMSDWVAELITVALKAQRSDGAQPPVSTASTPSPSPTDPNQPKKKPIERYDDHAPASAESVPPYSAPPFWASKAQQRPQ